MLRKHDALFPRRGFRGIKKGEEGAWLNEQLFSRPLGYMYAKASWPTVIDAMVFTKTMYPSTRIRRRGP